MTDDAPTVLVVDDDEDLLDVYEQYLAGDYAVKLAATGTEALDAVDESCQVVVLDRRLPDLPGREVLAHLRDLDHELRVVVVTAVEPDFDIVDMEFDDYLVKPVGEQRLRETVEHLLTRIRYSDLLEEHYRAANKVAALDAAKSGQQLAESEEYARLRRRARQLQEQVTETLLELDDYADAFHEVDRIPNLPDSE